MTSVAEWGTHRKPSTPVYLRGSTKVVGYVSAGRFLKTIVGSKHMLRKPQAIAFDVSTLDDAQAGGAVSVQVTDSETGKTYRAEINTIRTKGFPVVRGFGRQIALPLASFSIDGQPAQSDQPATNKERQELQMGLFGGAA